MQNKSHGHLLHMYIMIHCKCIQEFELQVWRLTCTSNTKPVYISKISGMEPTNNESERMLRKVVISRKIRQHLVTEMGMKI